MSMKDRVLVAGTKVTLVTMSGPPRIGLVLTIEDCVELVEAIIGAVEQAEENRKTAVLTSDGITFGDSAKIKKKEA